MLCQHLQQLHFLQVRLFLLQVLQLFQARNPAHLLLYQPITFTFLRSFVLSKSARLIAFPFAAATFSAAPFENFHAATVILWPSSPDARTFPGTTTKSFSSVCLFILERLTILLCLEGFSKSSAILFQSIFCSLYAALLSAEMSSCNCGFDGPVLIAASISQVSQYRNLNFVHNCKHPYIEMQFVLPSPNLLS